MENRVKYPGYRQALFWVAANDDTEWLKDEPPIISVTAAMICDLFGVEEQRLIRDLRRMVKRVRQ